MSPADAEQRLARSLEDFLVRRTRGEQPRAEDYEEDLAGAFGEFTDILEVEQLIDELLEPAPEEALPREFAHFTLVREIGRGAVGIVYEGLHRELGRREAVKVLRAGLDAESSALDRFRQEAKVLARVRHDHIVHIYGAGQVDGQPYYSMALLDGEPLSDLIRDGRCPSPEELARGFAGLADALQMLHDHGIVHRDVKPSNIVVESDGNMVLADFGLAQSLENERMTRTGQALGTPLYMSPEQFLAKRDEIDGRTDVYGLGASLYEALAGKPVFQTDDVRVLLRMVVSERPEPLRRAAPTAPAACADIALKALEKRREDRYETAESMARDLRAFATGDRVRGRPVSPVRHVLRRVKPFALPIAAVLLFGLAWGIAYLNRSATLRVETGLSAQVRIDGQERGVGSVEVDLSAGLHTIEVFHEGVSIARHEVQLDAGDDKTVMVIPSPLKDPDDPAAVRALGSAVGLADEAGPRDRLRAGPSDRPVLTWPAGLVRANDVATYRLEIPDAFEDVGSQIVFRKGKTELARLPFVAEDTVTVEALPAAVLEVLQPGDKLTWAVVTARGRRTEQSFEIAPVDPTIDDELRKLDETLAEQSDGVRAYFRTQLLLERGLGMAALAEVVPLLDRENPTTHGVAPWIAAQAALHTLGAGGSTLAADVSEVLWYGDFPRSVVEAWVRPAVDED